MFNNVYTYLPDGKCTPQLVHQLTLQQNEVEPGVFLYSILYIRGQISFQVIATPYNEPDLVTTGDFTKKKLS